MNCDFSGIHERLIRANENIHNLDREVGRFIESGEYRVFSYEDKETLLKAVQYHKSRTVPLRFSVLAGEIIHHLRSCLDHVVWQFSGDWYRRSNRSVIEFPIFETRPIKPKRIAAFNGKIRGISDPGALMLIERLQPYNATYSIDFPPLIIHKMDIIDKHRELVLCTTVGSIPFPIELLERQIR